MEIIVISVLILLNGFFALSEIALVSSKRARLENLKIEGSSGAKFALRLLNNSENFLSAIQVGITLISIVTGVYGGVNIADDIAPVFQNNELTAPYANEIALSLTVLVITYVSIVIGELVPKTIALSKPEKVATRVAPIVFYFSQTFYPFVKLLSLSTSFINKLLRISKHSEQVTEEELRQLLKIASKEGIIEENQNIIHENAFYFYDKKAKHIMTHRTDVEWIDMDEPLDAIKESIINIHRSKIICCKGDLDNFQGVLYLKDYYKAISSGKDFKIKDLLIEPLVVFENVSAQKVLDLLRQKKVHICFVVNEYGGFEGIITIHDIIENIVGQIPEEGETYEPDVFVREDSSVLVSGDAPVEILVDIIEGFTIDFETVDYSTVAGFVLNQINKIPAIGDKFEYKGYKIEIVDVDDNRIDKLLVSKNIL